MGLLLSFLILIGGMWLLVPNDPVASNLFPQNVPLVQRKALDQEPISPIPLPVNLDADKVLLGQRLFHEPLLSSNNTVSCASCHKLALGGADGQPRSLGIKGRSGIFNAPTVFNTSLNYRWFWSGRALSLEDQLEGPVHNPVEFNSSWSEIEGKLRQVPQYQSAFARIYPEGISETSIKDALVSYERSLLTPNSRFDRYLKGQADAINAHEKQGYMLFKDYGCASCHQGVNVGGNMFQKFGVMEDPFQGRFTLTEADLGRYVVTGQEADRHVFRVPSLRNVALTAPYFHDGSVKTLDAAVLLMGRYQLGREIPREDALRIVAFLKTLTGQYQGRPLQ